MAGPVMHRFLAVLRLRWSAQAHQWAVSVLSTKTTPPGRTFTFLFGLTTPALLLRGPRL